MARIDDIKVMEGLKELILDQVRAIYGPKYSSGCAFSIITSRFNPGGSIIKVDYTAQAIVYIHPGSFTEWKLLAEGETGHSTQQAMEMLYRKLQEQADELTGTMAVTEL